MPRGGARPGAGRPKKPPVLLEIGTYDNPKDFLVALMRCPEADIRLRVDAAKVLLRYQPESGRESVLGGHRRMQRKINSFA